MPPPRRRGLTPKCCASAPSEATPNRASVRADFRTTACSTFAPSDHDCFGTYKHRTATRMSRPGFHFVLPGLAPRSGGWGTGRLTFSALRFDPFAADRSERDPRLPRCNPWGNRWVGWRRRPCGGDRPDAHFRFARIGEGRPIIWFQTRDHPCGRHVACGAAALGADPAVGEGRSLATNANQASVFNRRSLPPFTEPEA